MIEIGTTKKVPLRQRIGGQFVPQRCPHTAAPLYRHTPSEIWRVCREPLGGNFGRDKRRKLVAGLVAVDQLVLYPKGTRQEVRLNLNDIYAWALRNRALRSQLEKARERKERLKVSRERRSIARADARIRRQAKEARHA